MTNYTKLPKIELHLHLDCSLSYQVVSRLRPGTTEREYRQSFVGPPRCTDLVDFLTRAVKGIELMQTPEALRLVTLDLFEQLQADGVIYAEIRFAPLLHTQKGIAPAEVVRIIDGAVRDGIRQTGIQAGLILCTLRHFDERQSLQTVQLVEQFAGSHVVGFDIAGDEAGFPIDAHIAAFHYAHEKNIPCTAHAGEALGPDSVWQTMWHAHPQRIGHGVRSIEDPTLMALLKQQRIHLEVCPTSNVQTNIYPDLQDHRLDEIFNSGLSMSINTDARTISDVTLEKEYNKLERCFQWNRTHFLRCNLEAVAHAFAPESVKAELRQRILEEWS